MGLGKAYREEKRFIPFSQPLKQFYTRPCNRAIFIDVIRHIHAFRGRPAHRATKPGNRFIPLVAHSECLTPHKFLSFFPRHGNFRVGIALPGHPLVRNRPGRFVLEFSAIHTAGIEGLPNARRFVSLLSEILRDGQDIGVDIAHLCRQIPYSGMIRIHSGHQTRPRRTTDCLLAGCIEKNSSPFSDTVNIRCFNSVVTITTKHGFQVIHRQEQHVQRLGFSLG